MQKFEFLRQPFLGELAMSWREREIKRKVPFIVATYVYASSQGQRTHSARTNFILFNPVLDQVPPTFSMSEYVAANFGSFMLTYFI